MIYYDFFKDSTEINKKEKGKTIATVVNHNYCSKITVKPAKGNLTVLESSDIK
jgi:hypothetical protein